MITLQIERNLVKVESWDDVRALPGFTDSLDLKNNKLKEIIGQYTFKTRQQCGLSSCKTPHGKGFIASTKSGLVTNMGKDCGKTHFGVVFEQLSRDFARAVVEQEFRESLEGTKFRVEGYDNKIDEMARRLNGASHLNLKKKELHSSLQKYRWVEAEFDRMVRERDSVISRSRKATEEEIEELQSMRTQMVSDYITEKVGAIEGLAFLFPENDLRELLMVDLKKGLKHIKDMDLDKAVYRDLKKWSEWASKIDLKIQSAEKILRLGVQLFRHENLCQLAGLLDREGIQNNFIGSMKKVSLISTKSAEVES